MPVYLSSPPACSVFKISTSALQLSLLIHLAFHVIAAFEIQVNDLTMSKIYIGAYKEVK